MPIDVPTVTVILPTYNRAEMLREGLDALAAQTFADWHLVCVDDGSTDRNKDVVEEFASRVQQPVEYIYQKNQGPGVARQTALKRVRGEYVAFMDSDDPWLDYHLQECVDVLRQHADVDWVLTPARVLDLRTNQVLQENNFYRPDGAKLDGFGAFPIDVRDEGRLWVPDLVGVSDYILGHGELSGLQGSLLRRWVTDRVPIRPYRLFDDVALQIEMLAVGAKQAYLPNCPHLVYRIHTENTSLVNDAGQKNIAKRTAALTDGVNVFRELVASPVFTSSQRKLLRRRLASMLVWDLGYNTYIRNGKMSEARSAIWSGLRVRPFVPKAWKALLRSFL